VLGEVNAPGTFTVAREKINVLEALARAGDLTIYGVRNNVTLIREDNEGNKRYHTLNLNDANIVNSPYYYLQQNDIIYVEPNKIKAQNSAIGTSTSIWLSATGILMSVATLLVSIFK
jgi:polysaccharide export outer membrane protein